VSNLKTLIKQSKLKEKLIASTIRLPQETLSFINELGEQLSLTKQEMIRKLIEEGIEMAKDELKLSEILEDIDNEVQSFYILNTNKVNSFEDSDKMIKEGLASAFYSPWKNNIEKIKLDDIVFLYENGIGIVAYGKGTGVVIKQDRQGDKNECYCQVLKEYKILQNPINAQEIKKTLNRNFTFLRVMSRVYDGRKILDLMKS